MAEGILKDLVLDEVDTHNRIVPIEILSAGTHAITGNPASQYAIDVAAKSGINLNFHRSKYITDELVKSTDLILTMERSHTEFIKSRWPFAGSVTELKSYGLSEDNRPDSVEIMDPIGMGLDVYQDVFIELKSEINRILPIIFSMAKKKRGT